MSVFERFLTFWVTLCIIAGIFVGQAASGAFRVLGEATVAQVNVPVAILAWLMIVPMLLKIKLAALGQVGQHWRGIATTVGVQLAGQAVQPGAALATVVGVLIEAGDAVGRADRPRFARWV